MSDECRDFILREILFLCETAEAHGFELFINFHCESVTKSFGSDNVNMDRVLENAFATKADLERRNKE